MANIKPRVPCARETAGVDELTWGCLLEKIAALLALVATSPILLIVALATKLSCPRAPVFYRQQRVGVERRDPRRASPPAGMVDRRVTPGMGQLFMIWKLRTMIPNAESATGPVWASGDDPRITPLGKILRKTRIDELPQLFNVLTGEMSLIGPRPERPYFVEKLSRRIPEYPNRLLVLPGITGLAQVHREYDADEDDVKKKVQYDMFYVNNRNLRMKLMIMAKTIDVMLHRRGSH